LRTASDRSSRCTCPAISRTCKVSTSRLWITGSGPSSRAAPHSYPTKTLRELNRAYPRLADAFWRDTLVDAAIFREWIVNVGSREAYGRLAHLICEVFLKLRAIGLAQGQSFDLPITQAELGDALGLSTVHVNRSLMQLRGDGLITLSADAALSGMWRGSRKLARSIRPTCT
jgi:hypothetical protein